MSTSTSDSQTGGLQFDRAVPAAAPATSNRTEPAVECTNCHAAVPDEYYNVGKAAVCAKCRDAIVAQAAPVREWSLLARAALYGLGAAIAGAIIYYAVIAITDFEIGIVAILIGYMVGYAARKGARGRGGVRLQVLAVALTYFAVALAYLPMAMKSAKDDAPAAAATADSTSVSATAVADSVVTPAATRAAPSASTAGDEHGLLFSFGALLFLTLTLPVLVVFGSMPSGVLSAVIIGIGMRKAWQMTGAPDVRVRGPYRVGASPGGPTAAAAAV